MGIQDMLDKLGSLGGKVKVTPSLFIAPTTFDHHDRTCFSAEDAMAVGSTLESRAPEAAALENLSVFLGDLPATQKLALSPVVFLAASILLPHLAR